MWAHSWSENVAAGSCLADFVILGSKRALHFSVRFQALWQPASRYLSQHLLLLLDLPALREPALPL